MNEPNVITDTQLAGLKRLREQFPPELISKLPKPTKAQAQPGGPRISCPICGGYHHPNVIHLDYVGHAALTDRLLDCDPLWSWEPLAYDERGLPLFDGCGGLWIKLTVCGVTRLGYGNAAPSEYKDIGSREKEVIGDALRNAAMRGGAALDLWHKGGDLHPSKSEDDKDDNGAKPNRDVDIPVSPVDEAPNRFINADQEWAITDLLSESGADVEKFLKWMKVSHIRMIPESKFELVCHALREKIKFNVNQAAYNT